NAGKSTLANALVGKPQSITSDMPGTTRDWTMQLTDVNGIPVNLIDTAGRRESPDHLERDSLARADEKITHADLVILIVEANGCEKEQIAEQSADLPAQCEPLVVVNKCDLLPISSRSAGEFLYISALTGHNLDQLRTTIAHRLGLANPDPQAPLIFTQRQYNLLQRAAKNSSTETIVSILKKLIGQKG
ncbi:MAG: GTP-binding protein, partial [Candidatus Brocadiia bacterium]